MTQVEEAVALSDEPLVCNQIEYHPLINQDKVRAACAHHGLAVTAYCPIARNKVADEPVMCDIAQRHEASPAQIALAWLMSKGENIVPIPGTKRIAYLEENAAACDIHLSPVQRHELESAIANLEVAGQRYTDEGMKGLNA